ncbi:MAG: VWA domain-containing protein [Gammaproteobacteria bacterium]|nr:VWA domain-containing protein [Gammaproteobacteria bacterium]
MSRRRRRAQEEFNLSFLDVICCGFGAIILLLMITRISAPMVLEESTRDLNGRIAALQEELYRLRGEATVLNRDLTARREQLSEVLEYVARLDGDLSAIRGENAATPKDSAVNSRLIGQLEQARQRLSDEMKRLLGAQGRRRNDSIGGIPVDSEYVIFIIDTSGSMFNYAWPRAQRELINILNLYPKVKGIQVLDDEGGYMFSSYRGQWIPDTPARRKAIIQRFASWNPYSNSSPVEGIVHAIRTFYQPGRRISLYVFGDEFTGNSIAQVIDVVDRINGESANGERLVRIHAVGFPTQFANPANMQITGIRFATLMRDLSWRNNGTFVGLNDFR